VHRFGHRSEISELWSRRIQFVARRGRRDARSGVRSQRRLFPKLQCGADERSLKKIYARNQRIGRPGVAARRRRDRSLSGSPSGGPIYSADWVAWPQRLLRIPVEGGESTGIGEVPGKQLIGTLAISPDRRFLAFPFQDQNDEASSTLFVIPSNGGPPIKNFPGCSDLSTGPRMAAARA
jgi:hypothetical protein